MDLRRLVFVLLGLGLVLTLGVWYLRSTPRLVEVTPQDGAESISSSAPLRLVFSHPMQPESVQARLTTRPARQGTFTWEGSSLVFTPASPWPSGEMVEVHLAPGARSAGLVPLSISEALSWSFTVGRPMIAYLWPANSLAGLYALDPVSGETLTLNESPYGVLDFSLSPDGLTLYFSAGNGTGGSDIYRLVRSLESADRTTERILACPQAFCRSPRPSPDGDFLAFERNPLPGSGAALVPQVWLLALDEPGSGEAGEAAQVPAGDPAHPTRLPSWSTEGLLAFYDIQARAFILLDPRTQESLSIPNETGEPGDWSPDGNLFVFPEILFLPDESVGDETEGTPLAASHLILFDRRADTSRVLSQGQLVEDTFPVFSPNGAYLVFARKFLDPSRWTPGRQAWLMRPDGTEAIALTDKPYFSHSGFAWRPDGRQLAFLRFNQETLTDPPEIWLMESDGSSPVQLVIGGYAPQWIP